MIPRVLVSVDLTIGELEPLISHVNANLPPGITEEAREKMFRGIGQAAEQLVNRSFKEGMEFEAKHGFRSRGMTPI